MDNSKDEKLILIVEDSNIIRLTVKLLLSKYHGVRVLELDSAEQLFTSEWKYKEVNLLIMDIDLPGISGLDAMAKLNQDAQWQLIPKVMLTSYADRKTVILATRTGAVDYIRKPFNSKDLLERVEKVIGPLLLIDEETEPKKI